VLGSTLAATGDLSRARVELETAVELEAGMIDARRLLAQIYAQLGEHEFAIEQGRAYLEVRPGATDIRIIVGQSLIRVGRGEDAYDEIAKIPEDQRDESALFALGRIDLAYGRIEEGTAKLRRAEEMSPGNSQVLRSLVAIDRHAGTLDESLARVLRAQEANPNDTEIAELEGEVKLIMGDEAGAGAAFERAVELDSRNVTAQLQIADAEARAGNVDGMLAVVERAVAAVPESADLQYRLAQAYDRAGRRGDAISSYDKSIQLNPDLAMAKNNLAYLLAESGGDLDRALELAQQAKEELPDDGNAADTLGWVLLKRGLPSAAIGYLQEAAERLPKGAIEVQGVVHNHLAAAYEENKDLDKAIANSEASVGFFDQVAEQAKSRGLEAEEPEWAAESRARITRLQSAS
jgi:tetratricopeptide (TPR) repeat protein